MHITPEEVRSTAAMARLALSDEEARCMAAELGRILEYVESLGQIDVTGVEPLQHPLPLPPALRADSVGAHLARAEALRNAPAQEDGLFSVPAVLGQDA